MIKEQVDAIIKGYTDEGFDQDSRLVELGIDSIDTTEILFDIEKEFGIPLDDNYRLIFVSDIYKLIGA